MAPVNKGRGEGTRLGGANVFFEAIFRHNILKNKGDPEGSPLFPCVPFQSGIHLIDGRLYSPMMLGIGIYRGIPLIDG